MGGLSKKAYQQDTISSEQNLPYLKVDAGGLLFKQDTISPAKRKQDKATAAGIAEAYSFMHYSAVGIARKDLAAGLEFLREIDKNSRFPWLSANLINTEDQTPLFRPFTTLKVSDITVGIIGITDTTADAKLHNEENAALLDWQKVLPGIADDLSKTCDLIILLSSLAEDQNREIARTQPNIHIIVQATGASGNKHPERMNNTLITQTGKQGKYLGVMEIDWHSAGTWNRGDTKKLLGQKKSQIDRIEWQLSKYRRKGDPEEIFKDLPNKLNAYRRIIARKQVLEREIKEIEIVMAEEKRSAAPSTFSNRFIAMNTSLPDNQQVKEIVGKIKK